MISGNRIDIRNRKIQTVGGTADLLALNCSTKFYYKVNHFTTIGCGVYCSALIGWMIFGYCSCSSLDDRRPLANKIAQTTSNNQW